MSTVKQKNAHRTHVHRVVTGEYRLRNVDRVLTHDLLRCDDDGFFGWVEKEGNET